MKKTLLALAVAAVSTFAATASAASFDLLPNESTKVSVGLGGQVVSKFATEDNRSVDYSKGPAFYSKQYSSAFTHQLRFSPSLSLSTKYNDWSVSAKFKLRGLNKSLTYSQTAKTSEEAKNMYRYIDEPERVQGAVKGDLLNFGVNPGLAVTLNHPTYGNLYVTNAGNASATDFTLSSFDVKNENDKSLNASGLNRGVRYTFPKVVLSEGNEVTAKVAYLDNVGTNESKGKEYIKARQLGLSLSHQDLAVGVTDGTLNFSYDNRVNVEGGLHSRTSNAFELNYSVNTYGLTTKVNYTRLSTTKVARPEVTAGNYYDKTVARNLGVDFSYGLNDYANFELAYDYTKGHYNIFKDEYNYFKFSQNHVMVQYSTNPLATNFLGTSVSFSTELHFTKVVLRSDSVEGSTYSKFLDRSLEAKLTFNFL